MCLRSSSPLYSKTFSFLSVCDTLSFTVNVCYKYPYKSKYKWFLCILVSGLFYSWMTFSCHKTQQYKSVTEVVLPAAEMCWYNVQTCKNRTKDRWDRRRSSSLPENATSEARRLPLVTELTILWAVKASKIQKQDTKYQKCLLNHWVAVTKLCCVIF